MREHERGQRGRGADAALTGARRPLRGRHYLATCPAVPRRRHHEGAQARRLAAPAVASFLVAVQHSVPPASPLLELSAWDAILTCRRVEQAVVRNDLVDDLLSGLRVIAGS